MQPLIHKLKMLGIFLLLAIATNLAVLLGITLVVIGNRL
jgi:hypothetical protein